MDAGGVPNASLANAVWSSVNRSLTVSGGLNAGQKIQPLSQLVTTSLLAVATTSVLTYSATAGTVIEVGYVVTTAVSGTITAFVDIIQDSNTLSLPLYSGVVTWDGVGKSLAQNVVGTGQNVGDTLTFAVALGFVTSIVVQLRITATTLSTGAATLSVMWSHP